MTAVVWLAGYPENAYTSRHGGRSASKIWHPWQQPPWLQERCEEVGVAAPATGQAHFPRSFWILGFVLVRPGALWDPLAEWSDEARLLHRCHYDIYWGVAILIFGCQVCWQPSTCSCICVAIPLPTGLWEAPSTLTRCTSITCTCWRSGRKFSCGDPRRARKVSRACLQRTCSSSQMT